MFQNRQSKFWIFENRGKGVRSMLKDRGEPVPTWRCIVKYALRAWKFIVPNTNLHPLHRETGKIVNNKIRGNSGNFVCSYCKFLDSKDTGYFYIFSKISKFSKSVSHIKLFQIFGFGTGTFLVGQGKNRENTGNL